MSFISLYLLLSPFISLYLQIIGGMVSVTVGVFLDDLVHERHPVGEPCLHTLSLSIGILAYRPTADVSLHGLTEAIGVAHGLWPEL